MSLPLVSVIIPTHNESAVIVRNLKALKEQKYPCVEIVVVDDGSTDQTVKLAKSCTPYVYPRKHAERSVQRNFGAKKSRGKYLLFLDADMEVTSGVINECVRLASSTESLGAITIPENPIAENFWEKIKAFERSFYNDFGDLDTDAARFFPKKVFWKVGGYDTTITGPEDWDLPERISRLGFKIRRTVSRINHYERIPSLTKLLKKKYYYGLSSHRYFQKHDLTLIGPKTIYFLRPIFYKNWTRLLTHPILSIAMFFVLSLEQLFGGAGFLVGKLSNK